MTNDPAQDAVAFVFQRQEPAQTSLTKLRAVLMRYGLPVEKWGLAAAKSVEDLYSEIAAGETTLVIRDGRLLRKVGAVTLAITHQDEAGSRFKLMEDRQEFIDGRVRRRKLSGSISEKIKAAEPTLAAAQRALREELGIGESAAPTFVGSDEKTEESPSYPGLNTFYTFHNFSLSLRPEDFRAEGYIEREADKTTYFVWEKVA